MLDLKKQFPWFSNNPDYVYMDSGATTLKPKCVIDSIVNYYEKWGTNPHNTDSSFTNHAHNLVENTRIKLANLINAKKDEIIFNSGATEGLNMIANSICEDLIPGDEIILTYGEHASNILPWMQNAQKKGLIIKYVGDKNRLPTPNDYYSILSPRTRVVSFASGFNLTGDRLDETQISNIVKKYNENIFVVVDATQSIQHRKIDVKLSNIDYLVSSAHKMFGPTGVGMVYIKESLISQTLPIRYGGGMNFSIDLQSYQLMEGYMKFEGGTQNVAGIIGWGAAIDLLNNIGYPNIRSHEIELSNYAHKLLSTIPNIIIYNEGNDSPTIAFNYKDVFCQDLASYLGKKNIIVRSGLSCAKLFCNIIDTKALIRCSLYIYNTKEDIDKLYQALLEFKKGDEIDVIF